MEVTRWNMDTKGGRRRGKRREERRADRKEARKLRRDGPSKQYYGGTEEDLANTRKEAGEAVDESQARYKESADRLNTVADRADQQEREAAGDYRGQRQLTNQSRYAYGQAIDNIGTAASGAITQRDADLGKGPTLSQSADSILSQRAAELAGKPTIGQATDTALTAMDTNATNRLRNTIGMNNRQALGLAAGAGESGALATQQAIASAAAGGADALAQNNLNQNDLQAQLRFNAAQTQNQQDIDTANQGVDLRAGAAEAERAALFDRAKSDAAMTYDAANQQATQRGQQQLQDQASRDAATERQLKLLGQRADVSQAGATLGLENQGQRLVERQNVNIAQLGQDTKSAQDAYEAAKNKGFMATLNKLKNFNSTVSDTVETGLGGGGKLLGITK